ncbi:CPBP family intramembrane glutamic endopeptidase [Kribbella sp. NPDC004536]|uniref:CPBP family intramembrane glutamic endopeptidase n=1 Tax=Kribbella sp. NPDC004536 TaxID=3364106 RepID=UPI0036872515
MPPEPHVVPAPPGTPFHRLARTPKHTWWRPLAGTVLLAVMAVCVMVGVVVAWVIAHQLAVGESPDPFSTSSFSSSTESMAFAFTQLGIVMPVVGVAAWLAQRRPYWSVASVLNRIRWRWLLWCCLPALGYAALSYLVGLLVDALFPPADAIGNSGGAWIGFGAFAAPALVILVLVPFQSTAEEFVFRGWLIQAVGAYGPDAADGKAPWLRRLFRTPWPGIVISAVAFVSVHGYTGWAMADIFLFGLVLGWLAVRTGGLESGIALHVMNNLVAFLLPAAMGYGDQWNQQGGAPWTLLASDVVCLGVYAMVIDRLARRRAIARVS